MTATRKPKRVDQNDLYTMARCAQVEVEFDGEFAYATINRHEYKARLETTHACPPGDEGVMPCCGRTPFEVPRTDRMTLDADLVTCKGGTP